STDLGATGELIDVCSYPSQQPNSDPSDCVLTPSSCSSDTDCDDHNPCTVDKCVSGAGGVRFCDNAPGNAGTVCRPSAGPCDVAETCTGTSRECPPDTFAAGTVCRPSAGPCDVPENCTGSSADCPPDDSGSGCAPCATAADCNDNDVCTYDSCDGGVCSNTSIEGCKPCATAADCIDGNACTVDSC